MTGRATLTLIGLWCLTAAGCAKVTNEVAKDAPPVEAPVTAAATATAAEPTAAATATAAAVEAGTPARATPAAPLAAGRRDPVGDPAAGTAAQLSQPATTTDLPLVAPEQPTVVPANPAAAAPERASELIAPLLASPSAETLDFASLVTRLRKTKALNLRTKFAVKSESDDLLKRFRAYHTQHGTATLAELRLSYDSLFHKLHSLLEDTDPPLARDIDRSRAAIWAILADPAKFGASAQDVPSV
jgi:hypothetical protein